MSLEKIEALPHLVEINECHQARKLLSQFIHRYDQPSVLWPGGENNELTRKCITITIKLLSEEMSRLWNLALNEAKELESLTLLKQNSGDVLSVGAQLTSSDITKEENSSSPISSQSST